MGTGSLPSIATVETVIRRLSFALSESRRDSIYQSILAASQIDAEYAGMLGLAGLIALFGLLQNSEAVIIGAMLISSKPLSAAESHPDIDVVGHNR